MNDRPASRSPAELEALLAERPATRYVDALFPDLCGVLRGKRLPVAEAPKLWGEGLALPYSIFFLDATGDCLDPCGRGISDGDPDGIGHPIAGTLAPQAFTERPGARVLMSMCEPDGSPCRVEPRNVAARVLARFAELGLRPVVAFELEFYLLDRGLTAGGRPRRAVAPGRGVRERLVQVYGIEELEGFAAFFAALEDECRLQRIPASAASSEFAAGQYEVNLHHVADALVAADHAVLLRHVTRGVASRAGLRASFMSKPFADSAGSGTHLHVSLVDESGQNRFAAPGALGSSALGHAIAGLLATMPEAMALFAPDANAFRRLAPNAYAPVTRSWAPDNRSVAVRIPGGDPAGRRLEHRVAAANANPYLVLAAVLAGIHHGLREGLDPGAPARGNAGTEADPEVPLDWARALDRLEGSAVLREYLGGDYLELYCATKRLERARFERQITALEYQWYL